MVALWAVLACSPATPGEPLVDWAHTDAIPDAEEAAPARVPAGLRWHSIADPTRLTVPSGGSTALWLRARPRSGPVVFLPKSYVAVAVYADGARIREPDPYRYASGMPWHTVVLPPGTLQLTFRVFSRYTQVGFPRLPRTGERAEFLAAMVRRDLPRLVIAIVVLFVGLVSLVLTVRGQERKAFLGLGVYATALSGWMLFQTQSKQLWLDAMSIWFFVWWVSVPLVGAGLLLFLEAVFSWQALGTRASRFLRGLLLVLAGTSALAVVSLLSTTLFDATKAWVFVIGRSGSIVGTFVIGVFLARLARQGNREAAIFLAGFSIAAVGVLHDIALSVNLLPGGETWTGFSYVAVGIALVFILRMRLIELRHRLRAQEQSLAKYVQERDALARDLHDGIGGIVTNMQLLAERTNPDDAAPNLSTLSKLAAEGMAELRTLIVGFDDLPASYRELAVELRHQGSTALDGLAIQHDFRANVAPTAPHPELMPVVHVLRIHREALTNAIKHAEPNTLSVRFDVDSTGLVLEIIDDGRGLEARSNRRGTGRGLASMQRRARETGGQLEIRSNQQGTCVRLVLPFQAPDSTSPPATS